VFDVFVAKACDHTLLAFYTHAAEELLVGRPWPDTPATLLGLRVDTTVSIALQAGIERQSRDLLPEARASEGGERVEHAFCRPRADAAEARAENPELGVLARLEWEPVRELVLRRGLHVDQVVRVPPGEIAMAELDALVEGDDAGSAGAAALGGFKRLCGWLGFCEFAG